MELSPYLDLVQPASILIAALLVVRPLKSIANLLEKSRAPDPIAEFREEMQKLIEQERNGAFPGMTLREVTNSPGVDVTRLFNLAEESHRSAVHEAWAEVEKIAREAIEKIPPSQEPVAAAGPVRLGDTLFLANILDSTLFQLFNQLRRLRNLVLDARELEAATPEVMDYIRLSAGLTSRIARYQPSRQPTGNFTRNEGG